MPLAPWAALLELAQLEPRALLLLELGARLLARLRPGQPVRPQPRARPQAQPLELVELRQSVEAQQQAQGPRKRSPSWAPRQR